MILKPRVYLSQELYGLITDSVPIICVDMILYDETLERTGFILRGKKHALIGGRIGLGESIDEAVKRHIKNDLGITRFQYYQCSPNSPIHVHEYEKANKSTEEEKGFDPTKNSIALTFVVTTKQNPKPNNEANGFKWATSSEIDNIVFDFGQEKVVDKVLRIIKIN